MPDTRITEAEDKRRSQRAAHIVSNPDNTSQMASEVSSLSQPGAMSLIGGPAGRANLGMRAQALRQMQQTHGNRAVQRFVQRSTQGVPVQREPVPLTPDEEEKKKNKKVASNVTGAMKVGKGALKQSGPADFEREGSKGLNRGYGVGIDTATELMKRLASGQGWGEAAGGAATQGAVSTISSSKAYEKATESVLGKPSKGASIAGLVGTGMKLLGSLIGEKPEDIGVGDAGEVVSNAATVASPHMALAEGVSGGTKSAYNTAAGLIDMARTGNTKHLEGTRAGNVRGDSSTVVQGWAMMGELLASATSGNTKNLDEMRKANAKGENGGLPQLGSKYGAFVRDSKLGRWSRETLNSTAESVVDAVHNVDFDSISALNPTAGLSLLGGGGGPSEAAQMHNQAAFVGKRVKETADLEKNKEQIIKEDGADAYYRQFLLANAPPEVRKAMEAAH